MLYRDIIDENLLSRNFEECISDSNGSWNHKELYDSKVFYSIQLHNHGLRKGDYLVSFLPKSRETVALLLACFDCGVVFVPLDSSLPEKRIEHIFSLISPKIVIVEDEQIGLDSSHLTLDKLLETKQDPNTYIKATITGKDAAYCMFTSGSTGSPKGVVISHGSLTSLSKNLDKSFPLNKSSRFLSLGPIFFDISVVDMLYPLSKSAKLVLYDDQYPFPSRILSLIESYKITNFCAVTALLTLMSADNEEFNSYDLSSLKQIMTGGEAPSKALVKKWKSKVNNLSVLNGYGPTEFTCTCIVHDVLESELDDKLDIPIGNPIPEIIARILINDEISEVGRGELVLAGPQMLTSYWSDSNEYERKTLVCDGVTYYRTGDLVKKSEFEPFVYIGRTDDEVKVSGHRINLGDIRLHLEQNFNFEEYQLVVANIDLDTSILALVIQDRTFKEDTVKEIKESIALRFPDYYTPKYVAIVNSMPLLPGGKTDRKALKTYIQNLIIEKSMSFIDMR